MSREILVNVLQPAEFKELWAQGYRPALPVTAQEFSMGNVLPAMLYMMRWGHRRGMGQFQKVHGSPDGKEATIADVADHLTKDTLHFDGFADHTAQAVCGDMLLAFCLENEKHKMGRQAQVQRVFPTHYFSSWIDLPRDSANLRFVPEMIVATLLRDNGGGHFKIAGGFEQNLLLALVGKGTSIVGQQDNITADRFDEQSEVGIDQLLTIRLAQSLKEAPIKLRGKDPELPKQQAVAQRAGDIFYDDFNIFLRAYGKYIPRQSLLPMLESCLGIGLSNIYLSTFHILLEWAETGRVPPKNEQTPWPLFVDCSLSADKKLRDLSEECMDDLVRRMSRLPIIMMCLRILESRARRRGLKNIPSSAPDPSGLIDFLGSLLYGDTRDADRVRDSIEETCNDLAESLESAEERQHVAVLRNDGLHPAWRLAETLVTLMGETLQAGQQRRHLDSCLMMNEPNGLGKKRRATIKGKATDRRCLTLSNTTLDFLVHRHLRAAKKGVKSTLLSLAGFIEILRADYGLYIDEAPEGLSVPTELLRENRRHLERRLRDLGLFVGVNDAEAMKRLRPRFEVENV